MDFQKAPNGTPIRIRCPLRGRIVGLARMIHEALSRPRQTLLVALATATATAAAAGACGPAEPERAEPMSSETYVEVMSALADLKRFPPPSPNVEERAALADSARRDILDRHGVTAEQLLEFAEIAGSEPARMMEITERIVAATDSLARMRRDPAAAEGATPEDAAPADTAGAADTTPRADTADVLPARREAPVRPLVRPDSRGLREELRRLKEGAAADSAADSGTDTAPAHAPAGGRAP